MKKFLALKIFRLNRRFFFNSNRNQEITLYKKGFPSSFLPIGINTGAFASISDRMKQKKRLESAGWDDEFICFFFCEGRWNNLLHLFEKKSPNNGSMEEYWNYFLIRILLLIPKNSDRKDIIISISWFKTFSFFLAFLKKMHCHAMWILDQFWAMTCCFSKQFRKTERFVWEIRFNSIQPGSKFLGIIIFRLCCKK